ncbi:hypothetical protein [Kitasatospora sp. NPDC088346]|uniref:hypothetical protein n=1 Tax=Kitasatospora sp. NPDC088346 TaxID=3364073 RepID=UPI0037FA04A0
MTGSEEHTPQPDEETRERSAEERSITAPTPADVRAKAPDSDDEEDNEGDEGDRPPAADTRAP